MRTDAEQNGKLCEIMRFGKILRNAMKTRRKT